MPGHCPKNGCGLASRQLSELLDRGHDANGGVIPVKARHDEYAVVGGRPGGVDGSLSLGIVELDWHDHAGEHDNVG